MFDLSVRHETDDTGVDPYKSVNMETAKWVGAKLDSVYPGHPWLVVCDTRNGIISIQIRGIMPANRWYVVKLNDVKSDPGGRHTILRGAGELLERYQIPRRGFSEHHWFDAMDKAPVRGRGHLEPLR